jgi:hypothetical protein
MAYSTTNTAGSESPSPDEAMLWSIDVDAFLNDSTETTQPTTTPLSYSSHHPVLESADMYLDADIEQILSFIALLDTTSTPNETGWTHATASRALATKRHYASFDWQNGDVADFDLFSHFDPELRDDLRCAFSRWRRNGHTGDDDVSQTENPLFDHDKLRAASTPSAEKMQSQLAIRKVQVDMEWDNVVMNSLDGLFRPTLLVSGDEGN